MMVINNFRKFVKSHPGMFFLISFAQVASILVIMFSYGVFINSKQGIDDLSYEGQTYALSFNLSDETNENNIEKLKEVLPELLEKYSRQIEKCTVMTLIPVEDEDGNYDYNDMIENLYFMSSFRVEDEKYENVEMVPEEFLEGRGIGDKDENTENPVCVVTRNIAENPGAKVNINDVEYEVVGVSKFDSDDVNAVRYFTTDKMMMVPFRYIPDNSKIFRISIRFNMVILSSEYEYMNKLMSDTFGNDITGLPEGYRVDYDEKKVFQSMMLIVAILGVLAADSMIAIYTYILKKREKETGIFLVCGASKRDIIKIYVVEMSLQLISFSVLGYVFFQFLIRRWLDLRYKWFHYIFTEKIEDCRKLVVIFVVFVIVFTSSNIIWRIKKSPIKIIKRN